MGTPLSMMIIGALISKINIRSAFTNWLSYLIAFVKMMLTPIIVIFLLRFLNVEPVIAAICAVLSAMPPAVMLAIFADRYKVIPEFITKTIVLSMVLYIGIMPIIVFIIEKVYPGVFVL
jgi:predicted permease